MRGHVSKDLVTVMGSEGRRQIHRSAFHRIAGTWDDCASSTRSLS
jgi:hypothetical protein